MNQKLIEISMDNNTKIYIEGTDYQISKDTDSVMTPATSEEKIVKKAKDYLENSIEQIKYFSNSVAKSIKNIDMCPDEFEIEFGVKFTSDIGIIISSIGAEAGLTVKMKWNKTKEIK